MDNERKIPFNKPFKTGKESTYIEMAIENSHISGDGLFTKKCHNFFQQKYSFKKALLTTSCTDALEMAAILLNIKEGDEIIAPSFTFVSSVNPFILRGAKIIFADSRIDHPGIDEEKIESLITSKTKAIVCVHYAGIACDMDKIMSIANKHSIFVIEDAAHAIDSFYMDYLGNKKVLGSIGHLGVFSFHETKNIISGEGGMLVINDKQFIERAEIIREKGTNRSQFFRGEVDKYNWVDIGSSFLPSDIIAAFLFAQLENIELIQQKRISIWNYYFNKLKALEVKGVLRLPHIPNYAFNNGHMFYLICKNLKQRTALINHLQSDNIGAVFHYLSLHNSPYYKNKYDGIELENATRFSDTIIRLPFYFELTNQQIDKVVNSIATFYTL